MHRRAIAVPLLMLHLLLTAPTGQAELVDIPQANVIGVGCVDMETDYVPRVVACENGAASFEALKAQAVAARTYAYYRLLDTGSIEDGTGDQVYTCGQSPLAQHFQAAAATECQILTYPGTEVCDVIAAFYVAGATTTYTGAAPFFMNVISDPTNTEQWVTYNYDLAGANIMQTPLGFTTSNPLDFTDNRGCMSQNGSDTLSDNGWTYVEILEFYYGADIGITTVPNCGNGPPLPACAPLDCNNNGIDDKIDLASGNSADCNDTAVPDECELAGNDCNGNTVPDECEFFGEVIWSDDFDVNSSAAWDVFDHNGDFTAQFAFNYAAHGIPPAPNTVGGTTRGLKFTANNNDGTPAADAVSAFPVGQFFDGEFTLRFDMWLNYNGGPGGGSGSTEYAIAGINHFGDRVVWRNNPAADGFWFAVTGEGGANQDYEAVRNATVLSAAAGGFEAGSLNASSAYYQKIFPSPPFESPGSPGKQWVEVAIARSGGVIEWRMDNSLIATRTDFTVTSGNVMLGYQDIFASIANPAAQNFVIYDNVRVTIPEADCNANQLPDSCELATGAAIDCNANGVLDECEQITLGDFNADGATDSDDLLGFVDCSAGVDSAPAPSEPACTAACLLAFDTDLDGDIDLRDYAAIP